MKPDQQAEILQRLRSAAGHLNAVINMAEGDQPCEEVLYQLNAVETALRTAGIRLIICQAQSSQAVILGSPSPDERVAQLERLRSLYLLFRQYSHYSSEVSP